MKKPLQFTVRDVYNAWGEGIDLARELVGDDSTYYQIYYWYDDSSVQEIQISGEIAGMYDVLLADNTYVTLDGLDSLLLVAVYVGNSPEDDIQ